LNNLSTYLKEEKEAKRKGGLYHKTQVNLAYNSNKIEGSKLTEEQTRYIFETRTIGFKDQEAVPVDDIIETSNHFVAFDYLLDTIDEAFSNTVIKEFHRILKTGTSDAAKNWFNVGDWKKLPNEVGGTETTLPQNVEKEMNKLNDWYNSVNRHCGLDPQSPEYSKFLLENIVEYHYRFEKIHPFQDGNGRVGRLIIFRECLKNGIVPFIIDDNHKQFYYRGLKEFENARGYLMDTCLSAQDTYTEWIKYFYGGLSGEREYEKQ
jgi:Fic family protein